MAAKLEIEVIDRGTPQQQGAAGGGVPMGAGAVPGQMPAGHSQFPPGSVGDVAQRWQQTGAMNSVAGSVPGVATPMVSQLGSTVQPNTVEESARGWELPPGWTQKPDGTLVQDLAEREMRSKRKTKEEKEEEEDANYNPDAGLDRLLWQSGFGKLGNLAAMVDARENLKPKATDFQRAAADVGVASAASGVIGGVGDTVAGGVRGAGSMAASIASNDTDTINKVVDGMEGLARKVPIVGEALGGTLAAIAAPGRALQEVFGALVNRGKEIGQYSGAISQAQAMQDVTSILADIKEAQNNEEGYAALIQAQTEFNSAWREAFAPVRKMLIDDLGAFIQENKGAMIGALIDIAGHTKTTVLILGAIAKFAAGWVRWVPILRGLAPALTAALDHIAEMNERGKKKDSDPISTLDNLFELLEGRRQRPRRPGGNP